MTIDVLLVLGGERSQLADIEVRVHRLERIEGPPYLVYPLVESCPPLGELHTESQPGSSPVSPHRRHVGPPERSSVRLAAGESVRESDGGSVAFLGNQDAAAVSIADEQERNGGEIFDVGETPDLLLQLDTGLIVFESSSSADPYLAHGHTRIQNPPKDQAATRRVMRL